MVRPFIILLSLFFATLSFHVSAKSKTQDEPKAFIETKLSPEKTIVGVSSIYSVIVYTNVPEILSVELIRDAEFGGLKESSLRAVQEESFVGERKIKGETYYGFVIDNRVLTSSKPGKFTIRGGEYNICIGVEEYVNDRFWGRQRTTVPIWIEATAPDIKFSVGNKTGKIKESSSASIGKFNAEWSVPPGDIHQNSRGISVLVISGNGTLDDSNLPDFKSAFGDEMNVVYVKPTITTRLKGTNLYSEMKILIEFIPLNSGRQIIPEIDFEYFDSESGKLKKTTADKVEINVKTDLESPSSKAKLYDI